MDLGANLSGQGHGETWLENAKHLSKFSGPPCEIALAGV